jgi:hypothetical protein
VLALMDWEYMEYHAESVQSQASLWLEESGIADVKGKATSRTGQSQGLCPWEDSCLGGTDFV